MNPTHVFPNFFKFYYNRLLEFHLRVLENACPLGTRSTSQLQIKIYIVGNLSKFIQLYNIVVIFTEHNLKICIQYKSIQHLQINIYER